MRPQTPVLTPPQPSRPGLLPGVTIVFAPQASLSGTASNELTSCPLVDIRYPYTRRVSIHGQVPDGPSRRTCRGPTLLRFHETHEQPPNLGTLGPANLDRPSRGFRAVPAHQCPLPLKLAEVRFNPARLVVRATTAGPRRRAIGRELPLWPRPPPVRRRLDDTDFASLEARNAWLERPPVPIKNIRPGQRAEFGQSSASTDNQPRTCSRNSSTSGCGRNASSKHGPVSVA
jgi:hypothetical protein